MRSPSSHRLAIVFCAALAAIGVGAFAPAPPGHEQMLRDLIADAAHGRIRYEAFSPSLADAIRPQAAIAQSQLTALGALKAVIFQAINRDGAEIYRTEFDNGALDWAFAVEPNGLISNASYRPATTTAK